MTPNLIKPTQLEKPERGPERVEGLSYLLKDSHNAGFFSYCLILLCFPPPLVVRAAPGGRATPSKAPLSQPALKNVI